MATLYPALCTLVDAAALLLTLVTLKMFFTPALNERYLLIFVVPVKSAR